VSQIPSSLIEFIRKTGAQFRVLDMGRRVQKMSADQFEKVEQGMAPYPQPFLHQAWIALLLWNQQQKEQNVVWFLKLPLDEQGYLVQAARDDLINRIYANIQMFMSEEPASEERDAMKDNPFSFQPDQEKMAAFHAYANKAMGKPASQYFESAQQYFSGQVDLDQWQNLGFQGIADYVVRLDQGNTEQKLCELLPKLPEQPLSVLSTNLENTIPGHKLYAALISRFSDTLKQGKASPEHIAALARGISNGHDEKAKQQIISELLDTDYALEPEVIVAVATRCWSALQEPTVLQKFLEKLAAGKAGQEGFSKILADLMFMPAMRALILMAFRNEDRSEALSAAIGTMFGKQFNQ